MTIIGYRKFNSKKGTPCCIVSLMSKVTPEQEQYGAVGSSVSEIFVPENLHDKFTPAVIGKSIEVQYTLLNGQPRVSGVVFS